MGRYTGDKRKHNRLPPFVPLLTATLDSPAWRAMSHGARSLYVALRRRYNSNSHNNGRVFLSQRKAAVELGSHHNEIARWFRELQHYGFIVLSSPGYLGVNGMGKSPHWRLTEIGYMHNLPSRDFERWDGRKFKSESRAPFPARTVLENPHGRVPESQPVECRSVLEKQHIAPHAGVPEGQHITRLPLPTDNSSEALPQLVVENEGSPSPRRSSQDDAETSPRHRGTQ